MNIESIAGYVAIALWIIAFNLSIGGCLESMRRDKELHEVGIERIEECHNAHSNWYEIVWKEGE